MTPKNNDDIPPRAFDRLPFRTPEWAHYRNDAPARGSGNPAYEAVPAPQDDQAIWHHVTANNPKLESNVHGLPPPARRERLDDVSQVIFPLRRQLALGEAFLSTIRNSYIDRNPAEQGYMERMIAGAGGGNYTASTGNGNVGAFSVIGPPGTGKSVTTKAIAYHSCPQVILHGRYKDQVLGLQQLCWLYIPCPPKASVSALLIAVAHALDHIFDGNVVRSVLNARNDSLRIPVIARALTRQVTGLVILDEFQNINVSSPHDREVFSNCIQELINTTRTRFAFIGTPETFRAIESEPLLRRMVGERGMLRWDPFKFDGEWHEEYLPQLWKWQFTCEPTPLTEELSETLHRCTNGTPGYVVALWTAVQAHIIGHTVHKREQITAKLLEKCMEQRFPEIYARTQFEHRRREAAKAAVRQRKAAERKPADPAARKPKKNPPMGSAPGGFDLNGIMPDP